MVEGIVILIIGGGGSLGKGWVWGWVVRGMFGSCYSGSVVAYLSLSGEWNCES